MSEPAKPKLFQIKDGQYDVLGGPVPLENAYVSSYAAYETKHANELELDEGAWANYSLSGSKGRYYVLRVQ